MIILAYVDKSSYREEITLLAGLLAILIATIGWIWTGRAAIIMTRKTNAIAFLHHISGAEIALLKDVVYPYIEAYDEFKRSDVGSKPPMPEAAVQKLLGHYEQLSVAVIHGAVDHDMIKASQLEVFKRIYRGLFHHIERAQEKNPRYFESFEKLNCAWHPDLQRKAAAMMDPGGLFAPMRGTDV
jgi:hypothetical protein